MRHGDERTTMREDILVDEIDYNKKIQCTMQRSLTSPAYYCHVLISCLSLAPRRSGRRCVAPTSYRYPDGTQIILARVTHARLEELSCHEILIRRYVVSTLWTSLVSFKNSEARSKLLKIFYDSTQDANRCAVATVHNFVFSLQESATGPSNHTSRHPDTLLRYL